MTREVVIHWLGHALEVGTFTAETLPARLKPASAPRMRKARDGLRCLWAVAVERCSSLVFLKAGGDG